MRNLSKIIVSFLITFIAGFIGSAFTTPSIRTWYAQLKKPFFNPPNWLFGPVWTMLYILMAISLFLVWESNSSPEHKRKALIIFAIQLALNSLWSILFFGLHSPLYAFVEIIFLWVAILMTIFSFSSASKTASLLLIPYLLWVSFAAFLNLNVYLLNR